MQEIILPSVGYWGRLSTFITAVGKVICIIGSLLIFSLGKWFGIVDSAFKFIWDTIARFAELDLSKLQSADFSSIEMIGAVNAMFPVSEFVFLLTIYSGAWILLILLRWCKSFIPTFSN
jgi:hypothetical protein